MSKKTVVTPRKCPRLVEGTSTDEVHAPSFNILTQTTSPKIVETPTRGGSSLLKDQKEKKNEAKKREFAAVTGLKCGLLTDFSDPSIPNRLITKYFGEMNKVPKLAFLNRFKEANLFEPEDRFKIGVILTLKACSRRLENNPTSFKFSQFHLALQIWFYKCCHSFDNTVAIRVAYGTPRILNWKTSNESIFFDDLKNTIFRTYGNQVELKELKDNVDKHMTELKAYADNSTKLIIINEIRSSRGQSTQTAQQEDDAHQHVEESEKTPMDLPSVSLREYVDISNTDAEAHNSIDQTVGGVFNVDIPGSSTSKPPTLDDYPDLTMTQIIELDPILNANRTSDVQPRNRNPEKYDTSLYIRLSEGESSLRRVPIFFRIKHPFESHNGFEVEAELIDEFNK
ncbi:hypothetical protein KY290_030977 [Solanum tuberosum]|uniref:Ulp1 protease family, C-terminal catalytic domain containing protein n=1 Tax=Solanum tuberosum TaxID=4113 RepID=A0ABQ7U9R3_SOLTU|nr:hypothetical protein KY290_030977 [Solanum tuberosum]